MKPKKRPKLFCGGSWNLIDANVGPELDLTPRERSHLTSAFITAFLDRTRAVAVVMPPAPERFSYARDPDDEPYLNLAVEVRAGYLVSRDNDLLDLQDPDSRPGQELRELLPQLTILDPVNFLQILPYPPYNAP